MAPQIGYANNSPFAARGGNADLRLVDLDFADTRSPSSACAYAPHASASPLTLSSCVGEQRGLETRDRRCLRCEVFPLVRIDWLKLPRSHSPSQGQLFITSGSHDWGIQATLLSEGAAESTATSLTYGQRCSICFYRGDSLCTVMCG
ncbi:hypothetical protein SRHO_G00138510 [Serrasalmus rhombeus]